MSSESEIYIPTPHERELTLATSDSLKVSGDGIFTTLQGEGPTAGAPAVFLRLQNCNLKCGFAGQGWRCDAWYTWDKTTPEYWRESSDITIEEVAEGVTNSWQSSFDSGNPRLVVTGGEPLLQQSKLIQLFSKLDGWNLEIETNGTISPDDRLSNVQINCSPKLHTSGNTLRARNRPDVLAKIATFANHWFKFVITNENDVSEMQEIVEKNGIDLSHVILMSEGVDADKLAKSDVGLAIIASKLGCLTTARNQIFWFGDKRAT